MDIDHSPRGIQIYMLSIACFGFIACSITFLFPYRDNEDLKGFGELAELEEPVKEPFIPTPEISRKVLQDPEEVGNLNVSGVSHFSSEIPAEET